MMRLSTRRLFFMVLLLVLFVMTTREITDPDFWWHLRTGQYIFETATIPRTDIFSFTYAGREWITHEWLSELFIYAVYRLGGWGGLVVSFALIVTGAFAVAYLDCERRGVGPIVAWAAVLLGAATTAPVWGVRPQMFSLLLTSIFIMMLGKCLKRGAGRSLWLLPIVMLVWVNLHGGYVLGLVLILLTIVGIVLDGLFEQKPRVEIWKSLKPVAFVFALCVLVVPLNPSGLRMFTYPFETLALPYTLEHVEEWLSPNFHQPRFLPLAALMLATFAALALSPKRARVSELLLLSATAYAVLRSGRHLPIFAFTAVPLLAEHASGLIKSHPWSLRLKTSAEKSLSNRQALLRFAVLALAAYISLMNVRNVVARQRVTEEQNFPARAVEFINSENLPGPIYNWYDWGGYIIWKLYPERRVYIDGRADVYGDRFVEEFIRTSKGEGDWREPLRRFDVRTVILKPDMPLASLLRQEESWSKVFEDNQAIVFVRQ